MNKMTIFLWEGKYPCTWKTIPKPYYSGEVRFKTILGTGLEDQEVQISSWDKVVVINTNKVVLDFVEKYKRGMGSAAF